MLRSRLIWLLMCGLALVSAAGFTSAAPSPGEGDASTSHTCQDLFPCNPLENDGNCGLCAVDGHDYGTYSLVTPNEIETGIETGDLNETDSTAACGHAANGICFGLPRGCIWSRWLYYHEPPDPNIFIDDRIRCNHIPGPKPQNTDPGGGGGPG